MIVINESWRLAPWAEVLYACDARWWSHRKGVPEFRGLKITQDRDAAVRFSDVEKVKVDLGNGRMLVDVPGKIGDGGCSGFQALNLAIQFGARRIILVGYDMRPDHPVHWHGRHDARKLVNPGLRQFVMWRKSLDSVAESIARLGVEVLNASEISTLTGYRKVEFRDALR